MAFSCTVDARERLGIVRLSGAVDGFQLVETVLALLEDPDWEPGIDVLWDGTRITQLIVSPDELDASARLSKSRIHQLGVGKTAIVIPPHLDDDMAYLFTALAHDPIRDRRVYSSTEQALDWLGKNPDAIRK